MPSIMGHIAPAIAFMPAFHNPYAPRRLWLLGMGLAMFPDIDAIGMYVGIPYSHLLGHRGFTHSIPFALGISALAVLGVFPKCAPRFSRVNAWAYLFISMASHGVLDALTDGGLGVAFCSPFITDRYFLPFQPILVSPLDPRDLVSEYGVLVFLNELTWIWTPGGSVAVLALVAKAVFNRASHKGHKHGGHREKPGG